LTSDPQELLSRLRARHIRTQYVREYFIPFRMMPDRMFDLERQTDPQPDTPINRDLVPVAYYLDLALWSTQFESGYQRVFHSLAQVRFAWVVLIVVFLVSAPVVVIRGWFKPGKRERSTAALCVAGMGLTLISLEVLLLLGFQALFGYVYHQLALLTAFFMVGIALGTWLTLRKSMAETNSGRREMFTLVWLQGIAAVSAPCFCLLLTLLGGVHNSLALGFVNRGLFPALALLAGALGGYQFLVASGVFFVGSRSVSKHLGALYAMDLLGACLGALALSAYLLPVFGFFQASVLIAVVNLGAGLLAVSVAWVTASHLEP